MNLAVNARDAMHHGGRLSILTSNVEVDKKCAEEHPPMKCGAYVLLSVTDTGCGIDSQTLPQIFEPFFTTKEPGKGTGLGLSIVYGAVNSSGGYVFVKSQPGCGQTLRNLPASHRRRDYAGITAPPTSMRGTETGLVAAGSTGRSKDYLPIAIVGGLVCARLIAVMGFFGGAAVAVAVMGASGAKRFAAYFFFFFMRRPVQAGGERRSAV